MSSYNLTPASRPLDREVIGQSLALTDREKHALAAALWPSYNQRKDAITIETLRGFFASYQEECATLDPAFQAVKTHQDLVHVIGALKAGSTVPKAELIRQVIASLPHLGSDHAKVASSVELALRLWLMINVRSAPANSERLLDMRTSLPWPDTLSIIELFRTRFECGQLNSSKRRQFANYFHLQNLQRIGGFQVMWTDSLLDHLSLKGSEGIMIFCHASVLHLLKADKCDLFPGDFLKETLETISLLLPTTIAGCNNWLQQQEKSHNLDPFMKYLPPAPREIEHYKYWRDRLLIIEEAFDDHEPGNIAQWWYDDRRKVQSYTFWVAATVLVLTVVFGLISSIASIVQAWASLKSLKGS